MRTWWWLCKTFKRYKTEGPFLCAKKNLHSNMPYLVGLMLVCLLLLASLPMPACYWCCLPSSVFIMLCYSYLFLWRIWHWICLPTDNMITKRLSILTYLYIFPLSGSNCNFWSPKSNHLRKKFFSLILQIILLMRFFFSFMTKYFLCGRFTLVGSKGEEK